ncbi:MAG: hypothetical protein WA096_07765 [Smithella sp.]
MGTELFSNDQKQKRAAKIAEQNFQPDREQRGCFCCHAMGAAG